MNADLKTGLSSDMTGVPDSPHVLLGAYVLGGLSTEDRHTFLEHLRSCPTCQHELAAAAWLRRCLARLGPGDWAQLAVRGAADAAETSQDLHDSNGRPTPSRGPLAL